MSTATKTAETMPLVSVIIPIYKVEAYLAECVDSVLHQTYHNLEIILVDDGSPDGCGAMCDAYAAQDGRVRVIHRPNGGLSAARNSGMDIATGEFITFLDSDDWMYRGTIEGYMQCFAKHPELDLVESRIYFASSDNPCNVGEYVGDPQAEDRLLTGSELLHSFTLDIYQVSMPAAWNKCYRRELLRGHRFAEGRVYEDLEFQLRLYPYVKNYLLWKQVNYYYRVNRTGAITDPDSMNKIAQLRDCYENLTQIIVDLEAQMDHGERISGCISIEEHLRYVHTWLMNFLKHPPCCPLSTSRMRHQLMPILRPYVQFLTSRSFQCIRQDMKKTYLLMKFSYSFYMRIYLPLLFRYRQKKEALIANFR